MKSNNDLLSPEDVLFNLDDIKEDVERTIDSFSSFDDSVEVKMKLSVIPEKIDKIKTYLKDKDFNDYLLQEKISKHNSNCLYDGEKIFLNITDLMLNLSEILNKYELFIKKHNLSYHNDTFDIYSNIYSLQSQIVQCMDSFNKYRISTTISIGGNDN